MSQSLLCVGGPMHGQRYYLPAFAPPFVNVVVPPEPIQATLWSGGGDDVVTTKIHTYLVERITLFGRHGALLISTGMTLEERDALTADLLLSDAAKEALRP